MPKINPEFDPNELLSRTPPPEEIASGRLTPPPSPAQFTTGQAPYNPNLLIPPTRKISRQDFLMIGVRGIVITGWAGIGYLLYKSFNTYMLYKAPPNGQPRLTPTSTRTIIAPTYSPGNETEPVNQPEATRIPQTVNPQTPIYVDRPELKYPIPTVTPRTRSPINVRPTTTPVPRRNSR